MKLVKIVTARGTSFTLGEDVSWLTSGTAKEIVEPGVENHFMVFTDDKLTIAVKDVVEEWWQIVEEEEMSVAPKTPHCVECSRTDVPLKPANQYEFLAKIGRHIPADLLCESCAGLVCRDLTGNSAYILPLDLSGHWLNEDKN